MVSTLVDWQWCVLKPRGRLVKGVACMDYVKSGAKDGGTGKVCLPTISHSPRFVRSLEGSVKASE